MNPFLRAGKSAEDSLRFQNPFLVVCYQKTESLVYWAQKPEFCGYE